MKAFSNPLCMILIERSSFAAVPSNFSMSYDLPAKPRNLLSTQIILSKQRSTSKRHREHSKATSLAGLGTLTGYHSQTSWEYSRSSSHRSKRRCRSKNTVSPVSTLIITIFGVAAAPDSESRRQAEALSGGMEEAYRSPMDTNGDQGKVPNYLQYVASHDQ
ncbi:hypothetical protein AYI70_g2081 [Smittium culicis]|uniref:Uncharacterized protein n=1 Tax=Smittium culicis TaxID=133412 RepID=A0A1R1Y9U4_9FUNG|nr:hypothetical protein AYI70_g2081 [Smittium culicis]